MQANEAYNSKQAEIKQLIAQLQKALKNHANKQKKQPDNWGYVGELSSVSNDLKNINEIIK